MKFLFILVLILVLILLFYLCKKSELFSVQFIGNTNIIYFFTKDLCDEWKNSIYTIKKQKLQDRVVVFPLDSDALECIKSENIKYDTRFLNKIKVGNADFDTTKFKQLVYFKILAIKHYIDLDYNVFYIDTDTVILGDIVKDIYTFPRGYDFYAQEDEGSICTGLMLLKPTDKIKKMLIEADKYFKNNWNNIMSNSDQSLIQKLIRENGIKYNLLSWKKYANGRKYFVTKKNYFKKHKPLFVHNNFIVGLKNKIKRFKDNGLWFI